MRFIGRELELRKLGRLIEDEGMGFALIYGRRRVGKSELIKRALSESKVKAIYYECKEVSGENNARSLAGLASSVLGLPRLGYGEMESLLRYLFELGEKEKMVLVLDEYPTSGRRSRGWTASSSPSSTSSGRDQSSPW